MRTYKKSKYNRRHGGPFDRGDADRHYGRPYNPHFYEGNTGMSPLVPESQMTPAQVKAYRAGYYSSDDN